MLVRKYETNVCNCTNHAKINVIMCSHCEHYDISQIDIVQKVSTLNVKQRLRVQRVYGQLHEY